MQGPGFLGSLLAPPLAIRLLEWLVQRERRRFAAGRQRATRQRDAPEGYQSSQTVTVPGYQSSSQPPRQFPDGVEGGLGVAAAGRRGGGGGGSGGGGLEDGGGSGGSGERRRDERGVNEVNNLLARRGTTSPSSGEQVPWGDARGDARGDEDQQTTAVGEQDSAGHVAIIVALLANVPAGVWVMLWCLWQPQFADRGDLPMFFGTAYILTGLVAGADTVFGALTFDRWREVQILFEILCQELFGTAPMNYHSTR